MAYNFNPTPAEASILAQIRARESSGDYQAIGPMTSTGKATGAYQFMDSTWQLAAQNTGVGLNCANAGSCSQDAQDINALWLLRYAGGNPNASIAWAETGCGSNTYGCYPTTDQLVQATGDGVTQPLVDLTGDAAAAPTASIMDQLQTAAADVGLPSSTPYVALAVGIPLVAYLLFA